MRSDRERLADIVSAVDDIMRYRQPRDLPDELVRAWVIHHVVLIGEAASGLSDQTRLELTEVPWDAIVGMRNRLVHAYFEIDDQTLWATVDKDLSELRDSISHYLG